MNLNKKKKLAARTLNVGKDRVIFLKSRIDDIKEAITKQDIRDLYKDGAIKIKEIKGRKKIIKGRKKRGVGKIKRRVKKRKRGYIIITRKLRGHIKKLRQQKNISKQKYLEIRKKIRGKSFKSLAQLKEYIKK